MLYRGRDAKLLKIAHVLGYLSRFWQRNFSRRRSGSDRRIYGSLGTDYISG
jgi:hypothetical protein